MIEEKKGKHLGLEDGVDLGECLRIIDARLKYMTTEQQELKELFTTKLLDMDGKIDEVNSLVKECRRDIGFLNERIKYLPTANLIIFFLLVSLVFHQW